MKYDNKEILKKQCVELYLKGKTMKEISEIIHCSRNYVGQLIKCDSRIINYRNAKVVKVNKLKNNNKMRIYISNHFLNKIGISNNSKEDEYVDVSVNEETKTITIKKHENKH